jgi:hypothetical protein
MMPNYDAAAVWWRKACSSLLIDLLYMSLKTAQVLHNMTPKLFNIHHVWSQLFNARYSKKPHR